MTNVVFQAAVQYVAAGISVIPIRVDGTKRPLSSYLPDYSWRPFQARLPSLDELASWFMPWGLIPGLAVIGGPVSGGLEIIDFDTPDLVAPWLERVRCTHPSLPTKLVQVWTPRGGHFYYRSESTEGSQKLARRTVVDPATGLIEIKTLIESKGNRSYAIVPPSPTGCHPSGRPYVYAGAKTLTELETISVEERSVLLGAARSFDEIPASPPSPPAPRRERRSGSPGGRPGDDFNARADWVELLESHGWTFVYESDGVQHWCRPGKSEGTSATLNHAGNDLLHVFTSNAPPLEPENSYSKFGFFTLVECDGDFHRAARELQRRGYGERGSANQRLPYGRRGALRSNWRSSWR